MKRLVTVVSAALLTLTIASPVFAQATPEEVGRFNEYLTKHPQIAAELARNPGLADDAKFIANHPGFHQYLENHPGVREQLKANPGSFMAREGGKYAWQNAAGSKPGTHANYDEYMEHHPEIWQEVADNPSVAQNHEWLEKHPEFREYLAHHPKALQHFKEHPYSYQGRGRQFGNEPMH